LHGTDIVMRRLEKPRAAIRGASSDGTRRCVAAFVPRSLAALVPVLVACSTLAIRTQAPPVAPVQPLDAHAVVLEESVIDAAIVLSFAGVIERIDEFVPPALVRLGPTPDRGAASDPDAKQWPDKIEGVRVRSVIERKSVQAQVAGTTLVVDAEFEVAAVAAIRRSKGPPLLRSCGCRGEAWCGGRTTRATPRVKVHVESELTVDASWRLAPSTSTSITVESSCDLGVDAGGQKIEVMDALLAPLRGRLDENVIAFDGALRELDGVRERVEHVWRALEQPVSITSDAHHLLLRPSAVELGELSGEALRLRVPVRFLMRPVVSSEAAAGPAAIPSPRPISDAAGLRLAAGIEIDLASASQPLRERLVGRRLPDRPARYVRISDVTIYGSSNHAIVRLSLDGAAKGEVFVRGRLKLDRDAGVIGLDELEVDASSREGIATLYDVIELPNHERRRVPWVTSEELVALVGAAAFWSIDEPVEALRENLVGGFGRSISSYLRLSASIAEIQLMHLWIDGEAIRLAVVAVGDLDVLPRDDLEPDDTPSPDAPARLHPRVSSKPDPTQ
jgi:hypothetical protein